LDVNHTQVAERAALLVTLQPSPPRTLSRAIVLYRTNAIFHTYPPTKGRFCIMDAFNAGIGGDVISADALQRTRDTAKSKTHDFTTHDVVQILKAQQSPYTLSRDKTCQKWADVIAKTEGIRLCRVTFTDERTRKTDVHYLTVDSWRKVIFDNAISIPIPFLDRTSHDLLRRLQFRQLTASWTCGVYRDRRVITQYL
jgi:hypothetical protein